MGACERDLPEDLARGARRFRVWRGRRKLGSRIPEPLWTLAVRLAGVHGLSRTSTVLGLDYYGLKKRVESAGEVPAHNQCFVELPAPPAIGKQCLLELDNGAGTTMRVQLLGYDATEIAVLSQSFWKAE